MTVAILIVTVLTAIKVGFYTSLPERHFYRDKHQLTQAIARYGYECNRRGWFFEPDFIAKDITELLGRIRASKVEIEFIPVYLEHAVDGHLRRRAEEMSAEAKKVAPRVNSVIAGVKPVLVVEKKTVEVLSDLYRQIQTETRTKRAPAMGKQMRLI